MADPLPYPGPPRWVKRSAAVVGALLALAAILFLAGGGEHGPGRHGLSGDAGGHAPAEGGRR